MTRFLFWNINRKSLNELIVSLVRSHEVDVLILSECQTPPQELLQNLNDGNGLGFHFPFSQCRDIKIFTRFSREFLRPKFESDRVSIRRLALPACTEILLVSVHLPSKLYWSEDSQEQECTELSRRIIMAEQEAGHDRTIVVGDLNMNPFEKGVVGAVGLNAAMTKKVASRRTRTVQGRVYPFFYNPMWSRFGDQPDGPPGTYYFERAEHVTYFWNIFDQVLIRPDLIERFQNDSMKIVTKAGDRPLVRPNGQPDKVSASDHLPVVFSLHL